MLHEWIRIRREDGAVLEVAKREGIPTDGWKYAIHGVNEDVPWDRIENMDGWWKDTTWKRFVLRELPDASLLEFQFQHSSHLHSPGSLEFTARVSRHALVLSLWDK